MKRKTYFCAFCRKTFPGEPDIVLGIFLEHIGALSMNVCPECSKPIKDSWEGRAQVSNISMGTARRKSIVERIVAWFHTTCCRPLQRKCRPGYNPPPPKR